MESFGLHFKFGWRLCKAETPSRSATELGSCWVRPAAGATITVRYLEDTVATLYKL